MHEEPVPPPTRRCTVTRARHGWDVKEEEDSQVVRRIHCTDWHRVERVVAIFTQYRDDQSHSTKR
jgi:hypothetical protein